MAKLFPRFEAVEALYDGLNGKIIPWTKQNGGTSDDPSAQVFVVAHDGKVIARCDDRTAHQPKAFIEWMKGQAGSWEKEHPRTKVPFIPADTTVKGEGAARTASCAALEEAIKAATPVLLYFARESADAKDKKAIAEAAECRKFEKGTLGSASAAEAASGWVLLRLDTAEVAGALLAARYGVTTVPALVALLPAEEKPVVMGAATSAGSLALLLGKHGKPKK